MWQHKNTRRLYNIIDFDSKVKINGVWHPAVIYRHVTEPQVYVRPKDNFLEKFDEVTSIGGV
jgi:hypothetical protein